MGTCFTLTSATRALVLIRPIVEDIRYHLYTLASLQQQSSTDALAQKHLKRLEACFEELKLIGALCSDPEKGIIDFPSFHKNIPIFLSWQLGEEAVTHWHYLNESTDLRRLADAAFIEEQNVCPTAPEAIA